MNEIENKVIKALRYVLGKKAGNIYLENRLVEDLGIDSFASLELIFELEDQLGIKIPDEEAKKLIAVRDVVNYISAVQVSK